MLARTFAQGVVAVVAMLVYFAPSIVADRRGRRSVLLLALVNALLGWTIVGWLAALYWAFHRDSPKKGDRIRSDRRGQARAAQCAAPGIGERIARLDNRRMVGRALLGISS